MNICSELQRDACCYSSGWCGYCAGMCAVNLSWCQLCEAPVASAAQTSCWETLLLLPQLQWRQLVCFVLLPVTRAAGNSSKIGVLKSFLKGTVPRKRNAVGGPSCAGFLGAGRRLGEESPPASVVPLLPSMVGKLQGLNNLIKGTVTGLSGHTCHKQGISFRKDPRALSPDSNW